MSVINQGTCRLGLHFERHRRIFFLCCFDLGLEIRGHFRRHALNLSLVCDKKRRLAYDGIIWKAYDLLYARTVCFLYEFALLSK